MAFNLNADRQDILGVMENGMVRSRAVPKNVRKTVNYTIGTDVEIWGRLVYPNGQPVDLTASSIVSYLTVMKNPNTTAVISLTGAVQAADGLGWVKWSVPSASFLQWPVGRYLWDWRMRVNSATWAIAVPLSTWNLLPRIGAQP